MSAGQPLDRVLLARRAFAVAGLALLAYGVAQLFVVVAWPDLVLLGLWMVGALVVHDGLLSPLVLAVGAGLRRFVPARGRGFVQLALVAGSMITVVALPMIYLEGSQPPEKAILLQRYGLNLTVLLGLVAVVTLVLYAVRVAADGRSEERRSAESAEGAAQSGDS
ncbi:hypothetical protein GCM10022197_04870 [Microlunatus spumicola]|uniref:Uncharacterized protein n=1 Tax=Microlunatus spumicola TaxID=81499 RepID=A0ABP6WL43_9ACTN